MQSVKNPIIQCILLQLEGLGSNKANKWFTSPNHLFTIRPLHLQNDLPLIFQWVNQEYAIAFWQMNGPYSLLKDTYVSIRSSSFAESLVGCLNGNPICQVDIYDPLYDPVSDHYQARHGDLGFHLLMAPGKKIIQNSTAKVVWLFLDLFFRCTAIQRIIGEPDEKNEKANQLLVKLQFEYREKLRMEQKIANFYTLSRARYEQLTLHAAL